MRQKSATNFAAALVPRNPSLSGLNTSVFNVGVQIKVPTIDTNFSLMLARVGVLFELGSE